MGVDVKIEGGILLSNWHGMRLDGGTDMANMANDDATSLKLSLKSKILLRRRKEGLNDIKVDFTPRPSYPMTVEEKKKNDKRRLSNRRSAHKSREKQRQQWKMNEEELRTLKDKQEILSKKILELEAEKSLYMSAVMRFEPESRIKAVLGEKVDDENLGKTTETVIHTSGEMDVEKDNCCSSVTGVLEISNIPFLSDSEFTYDHFLRSNFHDTFVSVENATESFDMDSDTALDILNSVIEENS